MFKKPATLKPASPLRSSARRAFISHLQLLYPILNHASPEQIVEIIPNGLKQCGAITSGGHKAIIYTNDQGKPLWFEVGHDAGLALQQSQQQHKKQAQNNNKNSSNSSKFKDDNLAEVIPTIYTLWLMPNLLPRLPTWPQIIDPTLLNGSALMIPGLLPSPHTFPDNLQWSPPESTGEQNKEGQSGYTLPLKSSLIAIVGYPSPVPLVIARLDTDIQEIIKKRSLGEKGKAASTIHAFGDQLWELGGKGSAPEAEEVENRTKAISSNGQSTTNGDTGEVEEAMESMSMNAANASQPEFEKNEISQQNGEKIEQEGSAGHKFSTEEVDEILHLALLSSLKSIAKQTPTALPMPTSALYSTHVLPNRPSHWPPFDAKGRKKARLPSHLFSSASNIAIEEAKVVEGESTDIRHCSAKKLAKWIKQEEKNGLFKSKEVKGKDTVISSINTSHADFKGLESYQTIVQLQQQKQIEIEKNSEQVEGNSSNGNSSSTPSKLSIVIERFWRANSSSVKLFQEMGCDTSTPLSKPVIRKRLLDFINEKELIDPRNQALIRIQDPNLTHALYPKVALNEIPVALRREEVLDRLLTVSCNEFHRTDRLLSENATKVIQINTKEQDSSMMKDVQINSIQGESIGHMTKGGAQSIKIEIKTRQGRKVVSLITNVEIYSIDPDQFAADLMKIVGASASCNPLPGSTTKNPKQEIFVQGDQRKAIFDLLESQHGLDRKHVQIHDMTKK